MHRKRYPVSRKIKRAFAREMREQKQRQLDERQRNERLVALLTKFIERHYGNPAKGRHGAILTGPVGARLFHAASLRALLIENEPIQ
jgi:hypothetical protein